VLEWVARVDDKRCGLHGSATIRDGLVPRVNRTSTGTWTSSVANPDTRSYLQSANRCSIMRFFPST
jgi:hypothetical protein